MTSSFPFVTNVSFYDFRESKTIQAVQIDIARLNTWLNDPTEEGINWNRVCGGSDGAHGNKNHPIDSIFVYNSVPRSSSQLPAVRVVNGQQLPSQWGLTIATPMPLYVLGNYNTQTNSFGSQSIATTNTAWTRPAALMGDAITILSSNWQDNITSGAYAPGGSYSSRVACNTTVNTALLEGIVPSITVASGPYAGKHYSGGLENFLRLQETWGNGAYILTYNGSIVALFPSLYATNYSIGPGTYYDKPVRNWGFDANFVNPLRLPPLTPTLGGNTNPPVITIQPQGQIIASGNTVTFSVTAFSPFPLSYQWSFNGTNLDGATNTSFTLTNVQLNQAGNYAVLVTNIFGSTLSSNAILTVTATAPTIQAQPTNQTVFVNGTATFAVTAMGSHAVELPVESQRNEPRWGHERFVHVDWCSMGSGWELHGPGDEYVRLDFEFKRIADSQSTTSMLTCGFRSGGLVASRRKCWRYDWQQQWDIGRQCRVCRR